MIRVMSVIRVTKAIGVIGVIRKIRMVGMIRVIGVTHGRRAHRGQARHDPLAPSSDGAKVSRF